MLEPVDPERFAPRISPRAVLIIYGTRDRVIVPEAGKALADAAREPKEVVTYPGDHGDFLAMTRPRSPTATQRLGAGSGC